MKKNSKSSESKYIDAFVLIVPQNRVSEYRKMAQEGAEIWMKYGALSYRECMGEDLSPDMQGQAFLTFPKMTKLKSNETVWFSYIEYKSKAHRNQVNKKVMKEMEKYTKENPDHMKKMPFDMKRFSYGGFKVEVSS
jgi:alkaline phosphatase